MRIVLLLAFLVLTVSEQKSNNQNNYPTITVSIEVLDTKTEQPIDSVHCVLTLEYELEYCQPYDIEWTQKRIKTLQNSFDSLDETQQKTVFRVIRDLKSCIEQYEEFQERFKRPSIDTFYTKNQQKRMILSQPLKSYNIEVNHKDYYTMSQSAEMDCFGTSIQLRMRKK